MSERADPPSLSGEAPTPQMAFPPGEYLMDELRARGWSLEKLAVRMGGEADVNLLALEMMVQIPQRHLLVGRTMAEQLSRALGTSAELWLNLDAAWQASPDSEAARIALETKYPREDGESVSRPPSEGTPNGVQL